METKLEDFRNAYNEAVVDKKEVFEYKGMEFLVGYAKYLLEYFEMNGVQEHQTVRFGRK